MTQAEYDERRDAILKQMAGPQDLRGPGGMGVTNRSMDDLRKALAALDADWLAQTTTPAARSSLTTFSRE